LQSSPQSAAPLCSAAWPLIAYRRILRALNLLADPSLIFDGCKAAVFPALVRRDSRVRDQATAGPAYYPASAVACRMISRTYMRADGDIAGWVIVRTDSRDEV
jgi:hypothetical protein